MEEQHTDTARPEPGEAVNEAAAPDTPHTAGSPGTLRERCLRPGDADDQASRAIANAEKALEQLSVNFDEWMAGESLDLAAARDAAKANGFSADPLAHLFQAAHNLKGQATTLGYPFADEICGSLCRLIDNIPDRSRLPADLVDQHVNAVRAIVREGARGAEHAKASVLAKKLRDVTNDFLSREYARSTPRGD